MAAIKKLFRIKVKVLFTSFHIFTGKNIAINFKINKMNFKIMLVVKTNQTLQSITHIHDHISRYKSYQKAKLG